jgi:hypothetical protein
MRTKSKLLLGLLICLLLLAIIEQTNVFSCYVSRFSSTTHTSSTVKARSGDFVSSVKVDRPIFRWLPFVKFGETVYLHTYQHPDGSAAIIERTATTRTRLLVIGLCSTSQYEKLASEPFQKLTKTIKSGEKKPARDAGGTFGETMKLRIFVLTISAWLLASLTCFADEKGNAHIEVKKVKPADDEILEEWERVTDEPDVLGVEVARTKQARWTWQVFIHAAEFVRGGTAEARLEKAVTAALRGVPGVKAVIREDREVWRLEGTPKGEEVVRACATAIDALAPEIRKHLPH